MAEQEMLLEAMRRDLRAIAPVLQREGWSPDEIAEISALVRSHLDSGDRAALEAVATWLADRRWKQTQADAARYQAQRARLVGVWHDEAALRAANRSWKRPVRLDDGGRDDWQQRSDDNTNPAAAD